MAKFPIKIIEVKIVVSVMRNNWLLVAEDWMLQKEGLMNLNMIFVRKQKN